MNTILHVGRQPASHETARHSHHDWELVYCTGGAGEFVFDGGLVLPYTTDQVAVIPPGMPHANRSVRGFTNIHILMSDLPLEADRPLIIDGDANRFLYDAFNAALHYFTGSFDGRAFLLPLYGQLIAASLAVRRPDWQRSEAVHRIETDILQNYANAAYDLNTCLRELPFNAEYLKKLFRKETGLTPLQYLTDVRLRNAANELALYDGKENISEIARLCGFSNPLYFSRLFKRKYGVSPRSYKSRALADAAL